MGKGLDVYLFLTGMMILSELARREGVFDWCASVAVAHAKESPVRLFWLIYGVGMVVTVFLSNDATAVVMTPAVLAATKTAKVEKPLPYLFACALVANAASFVLPISNPANLVLFGGHMPPLLQWLALFGVPSSFSIVATGAALYFVTRRDLAGTVEEPSEPAKLSAAGRLALGGIGLAVVALLIASAFRVDLGAPTLGIAVVALGLVVVQTTKHSGKPPRMFPGACCRWWRGFSWWWRRSPLASSSTSRHHRSLHGIVASKVMPFAVDTREPSIFTSAFNDL